MQSRLDRHGWLVRVRRENAPQRETDLIADLEQRADRPRVRLQLYEQVNPSASKHRGGHLIDTPRVCIVGGAAS